MLNWPFEITHFKICLLFFGGGKKGLKSLLSCDGDEHDSFAEDEAFCICFMHCVTVRCFFIILTLVLFWFGSCICCNNLILVLLWNDFYCGCSHDNCCHTIKDISQMPVLSLLSLQMCGWRQKLWAELSQDMPDISQHLSVASVAPRAENPLGGTKHNSACYLGFTSFLQSEVSQITFLLYVLKSIANIFLKIVIKEPLKLHQCRWGMVLAQSNWIAHRARQWKCGRSVDRSEVG